MQTSFVRHQSRNYDYRGRFLIDRGEVPIVLDDLSTGSRAAVPPGVPLIVGDVGNSELVSRLIQDHEINAVLHFAAKIIVPASVADPLGYYLNNTVKTHSLLQSAVGDGIAKGKIRFRQLGRALMT